jgi:methylenetetrahydrofolate reductase (NADPH)
MKMTHFCAITVPTYVTNRLHPIQHDDEAVKKAGCEIATEMCQTILKKSQHDSNEIDMLVDGFHFYTLNLERSTTRILIDLDVVEVHDASRSVSPSILMDQSSDYNDDDSKPGDNKIHRSRERGESITEEARSTRRQLPWKPSTMENRSKEAVRPINWSNRPHSYVMRTDDWDEVTFVRTFNF